MAFGGNIVNLIILYHVLAIASLLWVMWDAGRLGKSGCLWALIVWLSWPIGLIAYIVLRNKDVRL